MPGPDGRRACAADRSHFDSGADPPALRIEAIPAAGRSQSSGGSERPALAGGDGADLKSTAMRTLNGRLVRAAWPGAGPRGDLRPDGLGPACADSSPSRPRLESIARPDGPAIYGRVVGDPRGGFRFVPAGGEPAVPLEKAGVVTFDGPGADASLGYPPMRVLLGLDQQVSGRLGSVDAASIRLEDGPGRPAGGRRPAGASELAQRPGEALVIQDGFEALDPARWAHVGEPAVVDQPHLAGLAEPGLAGRRLGGDAPPGRAGRLGPAGGRLPRLGPDGRRPAVVRRPDLPRRQRPRVGPAVLDWSEESLGVAVSPAAPRWRSSGWPGSRAGTAWASGSAPRPSWPSTATSWPTAGARAGP